MRRSWNQATGRNLLLAARRHHRQVVGSDINTDSNEQRDKADPESPIMMCAPPVRSLTMAMMTLAVRMQMFGIMHGHARLQSIEKVGWCAMTAGENRGRPFPGGVCLDLNAAERQGGLRFRVLQPIGRPAVVSMEAVFVFTSERRRLSERGRAFDGIPPETDVHSRLRPTHLLNPRGRNQYLLARPPISR